MGKLVGGTSGLVRLGSIILSINLLEPSQAVAQAGSVGGVIGKENKDVSGTNSSRGGEGAVRDRSRATGPDRTQTRSRAAGGKVFDNPTINGIRVDRCMRWGPQDCNAPAANHWCRSKGFARATEWDSKDGPPTIFQDPQSSVRVCDQFFCGGFTKIVCE